MKIKKRMKVVLTLLVVSPLFLFSTGNSFREQMNKLGPFVGKWKTHSIYPGKDGVIPGDLEYRWILGKNWMMVEFVGQHPERDYWEAYAMIKFDTVKNHYISYEFFNADNPTLMIGTWISPQTLRFETRDEKGNSEGGIDYTIKENGTIYQENWRINKDNRREITLKTDYTRVK
jgi:hypothetical protein